MKHIYLILSFLFTSFTFACVCDTLNPALEFYSAEYVFEGTIVSKVYAKDFQTYTATFEISKHYKDGAKPETLSFIMKSESQYTNEWTSCDWSVKNGQKWLVYAHLGNDKLLYFDAMCLNSKNIDYYATIDSKQKILDNGNEFEIQDYIYYLEYGFTTPKPITNVDSIIKTAKIKEYKNTFTVIKLHVDDKGVLQSVVSYRNYAAIKKDKIFNLPYAIEVIEYPSLSDFEKEAIEVAKKIKKWEIKYHKKTKIPVSYFKSVIFQYGRIQKIGTNP